MTLAEHGRAHREGLADRRLGRLPTEVDDGHDVHDGDASDHFSNLARSRREGALPTFWERGTPGKRETGGRVPMSHPPAFLINDRWGVALWGP